MLTIRLVCSNQSPLTVVRVAFETRSQTILVASKCTFRIPIFDKLSSRHTLLDKIDAQSGPEIHTKYA